MARIRTKQNFELHINLFTFKFQNRIILAASNIFFTNLNYSKFGKHSAQNTLSTSISFIFDNREMFILTPFMYLFSSEHQIDRILKRVNKDSPLSSSCGKNGTESEASKKRKSCQPVLLKATPYDLPAHYTRETQMVAPPPGTSAPSNNIASALT